MFHHRLSESGRTLLCTIAVLCVATIALVFAAKLSPVAGSTEKTNSKASGRVTAPATTFPGSGFGPIPDGGAGCDPSPGQSVDVTFDVTGISSAPSSVSVSLTMTHSYLGDIGVLLISPDGTFHTLFNNTGSTTDGGFGDSSDLGATYVFSDTAPAPPSGGWWQEATARTASEIMTAGTYRTTAMGGVGQTNPAPPTSMNAAFAGIPTSNGMWTLSITDGCAQDTGAITAATLTLTAGVVIPQHVNDYNGDGKTDFTVARGTNSPFSAGRSDNTSPILQGFENSGETKGRIKRPVNTDRTEATLAPPIWWYTNNNGTTQYSAFQWGDAATDFVIVEDFDGDSKSDITVWRPGPPFGSNFYIFQSATNTVRYDTFGQEGDDPAVVGDYDGDGKADPAVYRCPASTDPDGQCYFFYRSSLTGVITYGPWGFGVDGDFFPYVGDFDGDGKNDYCIQRSNPSNPSQGQFVLRRSSDLGVEYIDWGLSSDFLIPGDYDGDGKTDLCVRRSNTPSAGLRSYFVLTRTGATIAQQWGLTGDTSVPGDYDGDGKTDFAIWRGSTTAGQSAFYILNSGTNSVSALQWGQCPAGNCDYAVAGWPVH